MFMSGVVAVVKSAESSVDDTTLIDSRLFCRVCLKEDRKTNHFQQKNITAFIQTHNRHFPHWQNRSKALCSAKPRRQSRYLLGRRCRVASDKHDRIPPFNHSPTFSTSRSRTAKQKRCKLSRTFRTFAKRQKLQKPQLRFSFGSSTLKHDGPEKLTKMGYRVDIRNVKSHHHKTPNTISTYLSLKSSASNRGLALIKTKKNKAVIVNSKRKVR